MQQEMPHVNMEDAQAPKAGDAQEDGSFPNSTMQL